jgi:hypothetical protein
MCKVIVGFDRGPDKMRYAARADTLYTSGLDNCIAVVAYWEDNTGAVMRHYDTNKLFDRVEFITSPTPQKVMLFRPHRLYSLKDRLEVTLKTNTLPLPNDLTSLYNPFYSPKPTTRIFYKVALGWLWTIVDQYAFLGSARTNLLDVLSTVFFVTPIGIGTSASFAVSNALMVTNNKYTSQHHRAHNHTGQ